MNAHGLDLTHTRCDGGEVCNCLKRLHEPGVAEAALLTDKLQHRAAVPDLWHIHCTPLYRPRVHNAWVEKCYVAEATLPII